MTEQRKADKTVTIRIKTMQTVEVKVSLSDLNRKTACQCCPNDKR